jgi:hypothetical protein
MLLASANAGQIIITHAGTYTFVVGQSDPAQPAVDIQTTDFVVLSHCRIFSTGTAIRAAQGYCSLWVDGCTISVLLPAGDRLFNFGDRIFSSSNTHGLTGRMMHSIFRTGELPLRLK